MSRRTAGLPLLVAAVVAAGGCGGDDDPMPGVDGGPPPAIDAGPGTDGGPVIPDGAVPPPPDCSPTVGGPRDGDPGGTLLIGARDATTGFTAWTEGATVPYVWGFQGGTMVMPVLRVEGSSLSGDPVCVHVELSNTFTDGDPPPDNPLFIQDVEVHIADGAYETEALFDMIHYDTPEGRALSLSATMSLSGWTSTGSVNVVVGPEGEFP